ncbi:hypothetical protein [Ensifer sp.]|uniref:hypothetical protein n=1 Tax=Ensifer sp. TaxID=1872086 RepID=UPI0028A1A3AA|nr:hypothetical protein [Ensifer sp.]
MKSFDHHFKGQFPLLKKVAANSKFPHRATIGSEIPHLVSAYIDYLRNQGNPWKITGYPKDPVLSEAMGALFASKMKLMAYIPAIRRANSGKCCSMCGSLGSTQVDHYLPRKHFPEFAVFKPNLFPICGCNQSKQHKTIGSNPGERFLHPAYDRKISDRGIFVRIREHGGTPTYTVSFVKPKRVHDAAAFDFHARTLISTDRLQQHVKEGFERFCRRPSSVLTVLKRRNPASKAELKEMLCDEIEEASRQHRTKNNWDSVFLHALLERRTLDWIWRRMSVPGRAVNGPLIAL